MDAKVTQQGYTAINSHANEVRVASFPEAEMLWQGLQLAFIRKTKQETHLT
jgi:hypothetical protein